MRIYSYSALFQFLNLSARTMLEDVKPFSLVAYRFRKMFGKYQMRHGANVSKTNNKH